METPEVNATSDAPIVKTTLEVTLPMSGEKVVLQKLKAGKYYSAQKIYLEWITLLQGAIKKAPSIPVDVAEKIKATEDIAEKERLASEFLSANKDTMDSSSFDGVLSIVDEARAKRLALLEMCMEIAKEELLEKYYPEDIEALITGVDTINGFLDNLKKSVAPSAGVGAK